MGGVYEWGLQGQNHAYVYGVFRVSWKDVDPQRAFFGSVPVRFEYLAPPRGPIAMAAKG